MSRRWQRKHERTNHTDDWLMTYADMITLLLCFFAIFLSVSIAKKDSPKNVETPPPIEQQKPPDILEGNLPFHGITEVRQPDMLEGNLPFHDPMQEEQPAPDLSAVALAKAEAAAEAPAQAVVDTVPATAPAVLPQTPLSEPKGGDRITILEMNSAAFFGSGSAVLSGSGKSILQNLSANLKSDKYKDYQVTVEGHTDDQPINTVQFPSNWELSTVRASAVVHFFLNQGVPARRLRAAGYADTFPKAPNRDANGNAIPQNQALNRRVVIKLEKIEKDE
jgi:flagellar motor protein MotB